MRKAFSIIGMRRAALVSLGCLLLTSPCRAQDEPLPKIFLEKRVYSSETAVGKKVFFETHSVSAGENLWKILSAHGPLTPEQFAEQSREFRRINPSVADPNRLVVGQAVQVPLPHPAQGPSMVSEGRAVAHVVRKGQSLTRILRSRGVARREMSKYLGAVKALNTELRDVNRILAGKTVYLPTAGWFGKAESVPERTAKAVTEVPPAAAVSTSETAPKEVAVAAVPQEPVPAPVVKETAAPAVEPKGVVEAPKVVPPPVVPQPVVSQQPVSLPDVTPPPVEPVPEPPSQKVEPKAVEAPAPVPVEAARVPELAKETSRPLPSPAPSGEKSSEPQPVALTKDVPHNAETGELAVGKPEAKLLPKAPSEEAPPTAAGSKTTALPLVPEKPPYRGLLSDLVSALGEKWLDHGTLYLPVPSGGEVVINLSEFPVVRSGSGVHALIDFNGSLSRDIKSLVTETWSDYRIVTMDGSPGPADRIDRLLRASGYFSVKEGMTHPLVIGESVAVTLPARWHVFRTKEALDAGDVVLIKEVPERLSSDLEAVLTYAGRVGIRVLPVAWDLTTREGFLAGLSERKRPGAPEPRWLPSAGLPAFDAAMALLGLPFETEPTLKLSGKDDAFRLVIRPDRTFTTGGRKYVVDSGRMSPAIRSLVKGAGYQIFGVEKTESGKMVFLRLLKTAGLPYEERREHRIAGGGSGYEIRVTGTFLTSKSLLESRGVRAIVLVRGRLHAATRALLKELGVEIIEWAS